MKYSNFCFLSALICIAIPCSILIESVFGPYDLYIVGVMLSLIFCWPFSDLIFKGLDFQRQENIVKTIPYDEHGNRIPSPFKTLPKGFQKQ